MIKFIKIILFFFFIFSNYSYSEINNKIIAKVGNEIITSYELKNRVKTVIFLSNLSLNQQNINKLKKKEFNYLVNSKLKKIEVEKYKINSDKAKINQHLNNITSNNVNEFKKKFIENNLNYNLFYEDIENEFKWQRLVYTLYLEKINVDDLQMDNEIKNITYLEFNLQRFDIILNKDVNLENFAQNVQKLIDKNDFEKSITNLNRDSFTVKKSELGWLGEKVLSEKIYLKIKDLKIGTVSSPIIEKNLITYLKVKNKRNSSLNKLNFEKEKEKISNIKKNELLKMYSNNHLSKVKSNILIEIK